MSWSHSLASHRCLLAAALATALGCGAEMPGAPSDPVLGVPTAPTAGLAAGSPVRGDLVSYVFTFEDHTEEHHYLRLPGAASEEFRLHFDSPPDISSGSTLEVWPRAITAGREIVVDRVKIISGGSLLETRQSALISGQPYRARRLAFVLVDLGRGVNVTKEMATQRLFGTNTNDGSLRQYYVEASYGRQDLGGDIIGPLKATMAGCNFSSLPQQLRAQIPGQYDHYLWYFGQSVAGCGFLGVAVSGTPDRPTRDSWYNASTGCVVLVQEPGHNFGMLHSSSMRCRGPGGEAATFVDVPQGNCTHSEYGDPYDPMGRACRHMNAYQKAFQGWFGKCNMVEVTSSGTFTLNPIELPCDGVQVLQIPMPKMRPFPRQGGGGPSGITVLTHYYVEMRAPHGFDRMIQPTVQVRASGDVRTRNQRGFHTWVLDMNAATTNVDGLAAGGTFTDPAGGIKITVEALNGQTATVKVEVPGGTGGPMCLDGTAFTGPGPGSESCTPSPSSPMGAPPSFGDGGVAPMPAADAGNMTPRDGGGSETGGGGAGGAGGGGAGGAGGSGIDNPNPNVPGTGGSSGADAGAAGRGGSGAARDSGAAGSGMSSTGGTGTGAPVSGSGCGCRVGGSDPAGGSAAIALVLGLGLAIRLGRRRR